MYIKQVMDHIGFAIYAPQPLICPLLPLPFAVLSGFPPKEILCPGKELLLGALGIRSGDTLIVEEDKQACRSKPKLSNEAPGKLARK